MNTQVTVVATLLLLAHISAVAAGAVALAKPVADYR